MTVKSRSCVRHLFSIVSVVLTLGALAFACADNKFGLGDDCIKGDDCQSGICTALKCTAAPPILDRDATPPLHDASTADVVEASVDSSPSDSSSDSAVDAADTGTD